jgi:hypothetical protein
MQQNFKEMFSGFSEASRVWIYSANREIAANEIDFIQRNLAEFTQQWATHGKELVAAAEVVLNNFVVFVVDEKQVKASGCSIDSSVRFIKSIGSELKIDFFNRLSILIENNGSLERIHFNELKSYPDSILFDTSIQNLSDFRSSFTVKLSESRLFNLI